LVPSKERAELGPVGWAWRLAANETESESDRARNRRVALRVFI
jgi:hypothetical protein